LFMAVVGAGADMANKLETAGLPFAYLNGAL
jgi:hypothetical protein